MHDHDEKEEVRLLKKILHELELILKEIKKDAVRSVASFQIFASTIIEENQMNINPGQSTVLTAVPLDLNGNPVTLPSGDVPNWSASDTSQITATPSTDGLSLTVAVNPGATAGDVVFTIADAVNPNAIGTSTLSITSVTPPPSGVASFNITASTPAKKR